MPLGSPDDYGLFTCSRSALASVRACKWCKHSEIYRYRSGLGRGAGMSGGNKARGRIIQHVKQAHPEQYREYMKRRSDSASGKPTNEAKQ